DDLARANQEIAELYRGAQANVEQLQELDRLKSRFLSMASHELKTPLTSISGLAQVLLRRMRRRLEQGRPDDGEWNEEQRAHVDSIVLSVQDPGVGIPAHQLEAVFGLFYQADDPVSRRTGGMGLGLYISKDIITRHGGSIWAESTLHEGSTFNVSLPRRPASVAAAHARPIRHAMAATSAAPQG